MKTLGSTVKRIWDFTGAGLVLIFPAPVIEIFWIILMARGGRLFLRRDPYGGRGFGPSEGSAFTFPRSCALHPVEAHSDQDL